MGNSAPTEARKPIPVTLHVYDLGIGGQMQGVNSVLGKMGTGAYHCGVEVGGREWSFRYISRGTGVFSCKPTKCDGHTHRESIHMGFTTLSEAEVNVLIQRTQKEWRGRSYELLTRNCCHYSEELCLRLGVGSIPWWTTSLAGAGATVRNIYDGVTGALNPTLLMGCVTRKEPDGRMGAVHG